MALATVLAIKVLGHEDTSTTVSMRAFATHAGHLVRGIHCVVLEHMKLLLLLVLDLFRLGVSLLLTLLTAATQTQHQMQCRLLLDVVVLECATILKLFASEDEALLIR